MSRQSDHQRKSAHASDRPTFAKVRLIYLREMRDQLRDRRTLFTIIVLPILLYPVVGMLLLQIVQFAQQHTIQVGILGVEHLAAESADGRISALVTAIPPLQSPDSSAMPGTGNQYEFSYASSEHAGEIEVFGYRTSELLVSRKDAGSIEVEMRRRAEVMVRDGEFDCVLCVPGSVDVAIDNANSATSFGLVYSVASDQSLAARDRVTAALNQWRGTWIRDRLALSGIDMLALDPFEIDAIDIAPEKTREAAFWSKVLPFIMLVWAMTGAFYPAIDLVAGEKERGTLETLLCSPALRSEIVWGKLGAVMTFSLMTAILNACSMLGTSSLVFHQIGIGGAASSMGSPPLIPLLWLLVALIPLSALFSALALAVAAMAKSSKEGQYYLMPLMMVTLPLVMLPLLPGTSLTIGTSLIPVTGMFLLVRTLVEGHLIEAFFHVPIVAIVTGLCLTLATRWAQRQFESESVLFGDGDQWELTAWVRHLWRDREVAATSQAAAGCGVVVLVGLFFAKLTVTEIPSTFEGLAKLIVLPQFGLILAPTLLMATMLTTSLRTSLRLRLPPLRTWLLIAVLPVALHPLYVQLAAWISHLYPLSPQAAEAMLPFAQQIAAAPWLSVVLLMAVIPAICEEIAFRGFIFGGLVRGNHPWRAVMVTAVMFGVSHGVLQQSISASIIGVLLGWVALRTGSVLPSIVIHFGINALSVSLDRLAQLDWPIINAALTTTATGPQYNPLYSIAAFLLAIACVRWLHEWTPTSGSINEADALADRCVAQPRPADPSMVLGTQPSPMA